MVEWPVYGGSLAAQHYSPLDQINAQNVKDLKVAWRWHGGNFGPNPEMKSETTPIMSAACCTRRRARRATSSRSMPAAGRRCGFGAQATATGSARLRAAHRGAASRTGTMVARSAHLHRDAGLPSVGARRGDRSAEARIRRGGHRGSAHWVAWSDGQRRGRLVVAAARRRRRRRGRPGRRCRRAAEREDSGEARCTRFRCAHRQAALDVSHDSGEGRGRLRHVVTPGSAEYTGNGGAWGPLAADPELGWCICPSRAPRATCTAASVTATTCSRAASSRST